MMVCLLSAFNPTALRFAFFDVDGTLTQEYDPYIYLHQRLGLWNQARSHVEMFERGEIDYEEWGKLDASLWAGQPVEHITHLLEEIPWVPGARQLTSDLRRLGVRMVLVSSGLDLHVDSVAEKIGAYRAYANKLVVAEGLITGEFIPQVVEGQKGKFVEGVIAQEDVSAECCIAFGDGTSDIEMFRRVGWSVAVAPREDEIRQAASLTLDRLDLSPLLDLFEGCGDTPEKGQHT